MSDGGASRSPDNAYEDLFENAPCGYVTTRPDGQITRANAVFRKWTGYTAEELASKRLHDILTIGTRILFETSFAPRLALSGSADEMSFDVRTASGSVLEVLASGSVKVGPDGKPASMRMAFLRASERRRYERQLVDANEKSRATEQTALELLRDERATAELREQFIAVLGHDLRNPLASLSGGVRLLGKAQADDRRDTLIQLMHGSITRMSVLIDNVLDFARGRLGAGIPLELRPDVSLAPLLEQVVDELRVGVPDRAIETDFAPILPVRCDPARIEQLVSNLLGNALTHGSPKQSVRIHADTADSKLTISVVNAGEQIPPVAMERLFQPFFRGEVRQSKQGLGLGLHISSEIAKAHRGAIDVESTADETRFTFQMPIEAAT